MRDERQTMFRRIDGYAPPYPEERAFARVSKDEKVPSIMVRDAAPRLLTMRPSTISIA
jgi:hypothetical protein